MENVKLENMEFASQGKRTILNIPMKVIKLGLLDPEAIYDVIFVKKTAEVASHD